MRSLKDIANRSFLSLEDLVTLEEFILNTGYMTREKALEEITQNIEAQIQNQIQLLGDHGEEWISNGFVYLDRTKSLCPFCGQNEI